MEPVAEHRVGDMSKSEILRGIITEKLSTAAREILAVVERTVSGYEEEAAGFRLEVEQQRRQLEALLLVSHIKLEATDDQQLFPVSEPPPPPPPEEESGGGEPVEEEQQHKYELSVEADGGVSLLCFTGEYHVEEESTEQALPTPTKDQGPITELDIDTLTGSFTPSVQSYRRSAGRQRISEVENHVDLRIRILGDSRINTLSSEVFQKYPLQELQCRRGLQETDFLHLLRSTFPQLAADFDFFTTDRSRKLHPLKVETLTPEEIHRSIRSNGNSALYIRLKVQRVVSVFQKQEEPQVSEEEFPPSQREAAAADSPSGRSEVQSDRCRPRIKETRNHVTLKLRILEDPETQMLSNDVYQTCPLQQLQCPRGLQEPDFLHLLRSTFPQLAGDKPFDVFTSDRHRKLHPLRVKSLTPEVINRSILTCGRAFLCIRLKHLDELQNREEHVPSAADQTNLNTSVQSDRKKVGRPRLESLDFKICILEDRQLNRISFNMFQTCPLQQLQCPRGLQETDFLHLLRSTFPQLAGDKPFDFLKSDRSKELHPLRAKTLTPEAIHRSIGSNGRSILYIQLKAPEEAQSNKETSRVLQGDVDAAEQTRLSRDDVRSSSSTSQGQEDEDIETKENDNKSLDRWSLHVFDSEREEDETIEEDNDWKPDKSEKNLRKRESEKTQRLRVKPSGTTMKRRRILSSPPASSPLAASSRASSPRAASSRASSSWASSTRALSTWASSTRASSPRASSPRAVTAEGEVIPSCKVCGAVRRSVSLVIKHAWSHVDDPARLCGVCGKCSESVEELRRHLQSHQKTHGCHICGKFFLSTNGLKGHIARHNGEKPYECNICHKAFTENWVLSSHMMIHSVKTSHTCDVCQKPFPSKMKLKLHRAAHSEPAARARSHVCEICSRKFHTSWRLQAHTRSHSGEFSSKSKLMTRIKIHTL
ncbi:zinc finger protein 853-like isoform X1 [Hippoglossus hippoglossus]|uniref:zinc finger protein 853-like isoform X1 n=1 Tax=Hippoglossus hippoglossus TaxID=8267 RepID=UPI00148DACF3|nr:zinc finger protein 853-like isoform X1 [Hippoglossus hippoglossus]